MSYRENTEQKNLLNQFLAEHGVQLSEETLDKLYQFADLVVDTKEFGNLISAKDAGKFLSRHIADSLVPYIFLRLENSLDPISRSAPSRMTGNALDPSTSLRSAQDDTVNSIPSVTLERSDRVQNDNHSSLKATVGSDLTPHNLKWADMGAGAGCPVFPLAIAMPSVQFYAVEPRHMRVNFMQMVKEKLHLDNLTVVGKRFETSGLDNLDFISCRALSTFENDWERAQPGLKRGGTFLTLKSFNNIVHLENDPAVHIYKYVLPNEEQDYALVTRGNE